MDLLKNSQFICNEDNSIKSLVSKQVVVGNICLLGGYLVVFIRFCQSKFAYLFEIPFFSVKQDVSWQWLYVY